MKLIPLSNRKGLPLFTKVDDEDFAKLTRMGSWLVIPPTKRKHNAYSYVGRFNTSTKKWERIHRLIIGAKDREIVDHINRDTLDNRKCNLRICDNQMNQYNQRKRSDSKYMRGVTFDKSSKKKPWKAQIKINGKNHHLGMFETEAEAHDRYKQRLLEVAGEFSPYA